MDRRSARRVLLRTFRKGLASRMMLLSLDLERPVFNHGLRPLLLSEGRVLLLPYDPIYQVSYKLEGRRSSE